MSESQPRWSPRHPFRVQALRFARSLIVGSGGTLLDFAALTLGIRVLGMDATWARVVGLCVGAVALFLGSRSFAFRAQSESAMPQAKRFVISELIGFPLNIMAFKLLLSVLPNVAPEALSLLANFVLFVTYYYPVRNYIVFKMQAPVVVLQVAPTPASAPVAEALARGVT